MKWTAILLLLTNVLYLGWEIDRETRIQIRNSPSVISIPSDAVKLQLISEIDTSPEPRARPSIPDIVEDTDFGQESLTDDELVAELPDILLNDSEEVMARLECSRYGPIPDENIVNELYGWFVSRKARAHIHYTEDRGSQLYWIYLAPQTTREGALALIEEIESKGIGDFRLINRGDLQNAISLGLYSSRGAVNNRLRELNDKGYVPVIVPYSDVTRIYWLDVKLVDSPLLKESIANGLPVKYDSDIINCSDITVL
ncbi:MAG: SPOR domain-containing protein [Gammaproteobacteria bacterium]|nr:SPOR domain-containing protein [Gammaproteobacteria bacterium]